MRSREVTDFTPEVLAAWDQLVYEITAHVGAPNLHHAPLWVDRHYGYVRDVGAVWFLPVGGVPTNHRVSIGESGRGPVGAAPAVPRRWHVSSGRHRGAITSAELHVTVPPDIELLRHVAGMAGLLVRSAS